MNKIVSGVGLGLRRPHIKALQQQPPQCLSFIELAPENWMGAGGWRRDVLDQLSQTFPIVCHGLSLSIGGMRPLNLTFIDNLKKFFKQHQVAIYSEHLSYSNDEGNLYDLLPVPFTTEAVFYVANRIKALQARLERRISFENISYYCALDQELSEVEFIKAIVSEAQCDLLLDINNVFVNSINHGYDPLMFLQDLKEVNISYIHIAGHSEQASDLLIDTHGAPVIEPVWILLEEAYRIWGAIPTLLERDHNIPTIQELIPELTKIENFQREVCHVSI